MMALFAIGLQPNLSMMTSPTEIAEENGFIVLNTESPPKKEIGRKSLKSLDVSHCFFVRPTLRFPRFWVQNDFSE